MNRAHKVVEAIIEAEAQVAILQAALNAAAEYPAAFECLEQGLKAIQEERPGWPHRKQADSGSSLPQCKQEADRGR